MVKIIKLNGRQTALKKRVIVFSPRVQSAISAILSGEQYIPKILTKKGHVSVETYLSEIDNASIDKIVVDVMRYAEGDVIEKAFEELGEFAAWLQSMGPLEVEA